MSGLYPQNGQDLGVLSDVFPDRLIALGTSSQASLSASGLHPQNIQE